MIEEKTLQQEGDQVPAPPFAFWPEFRSRIVGLGGHEDALDPDYAFHSTYVRSGDGEVAFEGRFTGLAGTGGTMIVRINEFPLYPNGKARQVAVKQFQVRDLAIEGGRFEIDAEARQGFAYAVWCNLYGEANVRADGLDIVAELRPANPDRWRQPISAGHDRIRSAAMLVARVEPSFAAPASQPLTPAQFTEPAFAALEEPLALHETADPVARWSRAYVAQVWQHYGLLKDAASVAGLDTEDAALTRFIENNGVRMFPVIASSTDPESLGDSSQPSGHEAGANDIAYSFIPAATARLWSLTLRYMDHALMRLKPGGWGVFVLPFVAGDDPDDGTGRDRPGLLTRHDIERIALVMISRGHQVAQMRVGKTFQGPMDNAPSAFGMTVRKRSD
ncbi:hypothetical protein PQ455_06450 [Sphingomonas naphthae]|uniref:Uncharacterized protein n=1 Tax=Sphingomonas naphthae TaxID=1813468 RepID=A0ABY7TNP4_9SPHN|nr:hypothetical protein [Sphingomonas naphthae]WCT74855.1 hypothetical protein PQ455_06450 [Sphingomonas naphthae]